MKIQVSIPPKMSYCRKMLACDCDIYFKPVKNLLKEQIIPELEKQSNVLPFYFVLPSVDPVVSSLVPWANPWANPNL